MNRGEIARGEITGGKSPGEFTCLDRVKEIGTINGRENFHSVFIGLNFSKDSSEIDAHGLTWFYETMFKGLLNTKDIMVLVQWCKTK